MIAYHGTENEFTIFDESKIGSSSGNMGFLGKGFYFSKQLEVARAYGNVKTVELSLEKPFTLNGYLSKEDIDILNKVTDTDAFDLGVNSEQVYQGISYLITQCPEMAEIIADNFMALGFDGVVYGDFREIVCFDSSSIKILN